MEKGGDYILGGKNAWGHGNRRDQGEQEAEARTGGACGQSVVGGKGRRKMGLGSRKVAKFCI
jgi:hypothetical protein